MTTHLPSRKGAFVRVGRFAAWPAHLALLGALTAAGCQTAPSRSIAQAGTPPTHVAAAPPDGEQKEKAEAAAPATTLLDVLPWVGTVKPPPPPVETLVLRGGDLVGDKPLKENSAEAMVAGAREYFRQGEFEKAESLYRRIADNTKNPVPVVEEARYYEGECLRLQGRYPKAADVYVDLLNKFPRNPYREQAMQHMFDIANYWLDDTREEMRETREKNEGKRWWVWPRFISFEKTKPFLDREGRAIEKLEQVRYNDINGPLADKALFLAGSVKFFNESYADADHYFSQIHENHPNSPLAPQAVELAIICKHLSTGGADYDGRKVAEARKLVDAAFKNYPELASKKQDFLMRQLVGITLQQAEKDYKMAEHWRWTGHPGSAYFYYELVCRRYPNTKYAEMAAKRRDELRAKLEAEGQPVQASPWSLFPSARSPQDPRSAPIEVAPTPRSLPNTLETAPAPRVTPPGLDR